MPAGSAFAVLGWDWAKLRLQTLVSLASELPMFAPDQCPAPSGTLSFRGMQPDAVLQS